MAGSRAITGSRLERGTLTRVHADGVAVLADLRDKRILLLCTVIPATDLAQSGMLDR